MGYLTGKIQQKINLINIIFITRAEFTSYLDHFRVFRGFPDNYLRDNIAGPHGNVVCPAQQICMVMILFSP
jgi:hypothetical protein